jgi:hypothetical protein
MAEIKKIAGNKISWIMEKYKSLKVLVVFFNLGLPTRWLTVIPP